ncbi:hypothetical protein H8S90_17735 [Olivibacter sp. SDN3]|uniref:hypothetical protein n=1 Tax=Olivibacter sp. SDN3 TaxID=2764720 RepID=UPI001650FD2B|nr:hypothetical protein [Olivibacter sp. SDN3]QNL48614.1 hypothetical protein H8S90_17735 [Olivibacter sp. SDN3]
MKRKELLRRTVVLGIISILFSFGSSWGQENSPAHIGIIYPISTHGTRAVDYTNNISLHAIAGLSGGENGFALYGAAGVVKGDVSGFQAAGIINQVSGSLNGVQMAGAINLAGSVSKGAQFAGIYNRSNGMLQTQLAGAINQSQQVQGFQAAGITNLTKELHGVQLAGAVNVADEVNGSQFAGILNKAKNVKGVQLGFMNIADSSDYPIGMINLIKNGEKRIGLGTDENLSTFISFRSGGRVLYGILGVGLNPQYESLRFGFEGGIGAKIIDKEHFRLDAEATSGTLTDFKGKDFTKSGIRILPALRIAQNLYLYGGPSINYVNTDNEDGKDLVKLKVWDKQTTEHYQAVQVGFTGGLQFVL